MKKELKPCPFCGCKKINESMTGALLCYVYCHACGAKSDNFGNHALAANHWNTRPQPSELSDEDIISESVNRIPNYLSVTNRRSDWMTAWQTGAEWAREWYRTHAPQQNIEELVDIFKETLSGSDGFNITFDSDEERMDFILDLTNAFRKLLKEKYNG